MLVTKRTEQMAVAILCGGLSSRMGTDKADLPVCDSTTGKSFLEHLCREMTGFGHNYISANAHQTYSIEGYTTITDLCDEIGPLGGIYSVLKNTAHAAVFCLACDMPLFTREAAAFLVRQWDGSPVAVSKVDEKREPLAGIYTKDCLPVIEKMISQKQYRLGILMDELSGQSIDMTAYGKCYRNINTVKEYIRYIEKWS